MATSSSALTDHLHCSICTEIYTDPVSLSCQHTFCKTCLQQSLDAGQQHCPECRLPVRDRNFQINRLIRNMADQLRVEEGRPERGGAEAEGVCPEHGESLRLFCETDSQLICSICRDGRKHRGHVFKPVKGAQEDLKNEVASVLAAAHKTAKAKKGTRGRQAELISDKRKKSDQLKTKIKAQFEEAIAKLREREEKAMRQIDEESGLAEMEESDCNRHTSDYSRREKRHPSVCYEDL